MSEFLKIAFYLLQNLEYVIVSGARRQENRWDPTENGQIVPETKETQKRLFDDAMFKLEHKTGDEDVSKQDKPRLNRLVGRNEAVWKDDYEANCVLRRNFRVSSSEFHHLVILQLITEHSLFIRGVQGHKLKSPVIAYKIQ